MEEFENFSDLDNLLALADEEIFCSNSKEAEKTEDLVKDGIFASSEIANENENDCVLVSVKSNPFSRIRSFISTKFTETIRGKSPLAQTSISAFFKPPKRLPEEEHVAELVEPKKSKKETERPFVFPTLNKPPITTTSAPSSGKQIKLPKFKLIPGTPFAVDAFSYGQIDQISGYFLTHFHSDHYKGLSNKLFAGSGTDRFSRRIYCSEVTGNLARKELNIREEFITTLKIGQIYVIENIHVGVLDANHCPGSVMFIFGVPFGDNLMKWYLHCGDFRAAPSIMNQKLIYFDDPVSKTMAFTDFLFESVYLDTTYAHPKHSFPPQERVMLACVEGCQKLLNGQYDPAGQKRLVPLKWLIAVGSYLIGKERIILAIAEAFDLLIYADDRKRSILKLLKWPELQDRLTNDPLVTPLHFVSMSLLSKQKLSDYRDSFHGRFSHVLGIKPTGWTFDEKDSSLWSLEMPKLEGNSGVWPVPYSEHSSFKELEEFLRVLNVHHVIPTVDNWADVVLDSRRVGGDPVNLLYQWASHKRR